MMVRTGFFVNIQTHFHHPNKHHRWTIFSQLKESYRSVDIRWMINMEMNGVAIKNCPNGETSPATQGCP